MKIKFRDRLRRLFLSRKDKKLLAEFENGRSLDFVDEEFKKEYYENG